MAPLHFGGVTPTCTSTQACCTVLEKTVTSAEIPVFKLVLGVSTLLSLAFIMIKLSQNQTKHFALYFNFFLLTVLTFFFEVVFLCIDVGSSSGTALIVYDVMRFFIVTLQWFVQIAVSMFMFEDTAGKAAVMRTLARTAGVVFLLDAVWVVFFVLYTGCYFCGLFIPEVILTMVFGGALLVQRTSCKIARPRPAANSFLFFLTVCHVWFGVSAGLSVVKKTYDLSMCVECLVDGAYYFLYAPLLYVTMTSDTVYWEREGARLMIQKLPAYNSVVSKRSLETSRLLQPPTETSPRSQLVGNIRVIAIGDLNFGECVGSGQFSEVFKGEWNGTTVAIKQLKIPSDQDKADALLETMLDEAATHTLLRHPNVIQFYGACIDPPHLCMVTEFAAHGALFDVIRAQPVRSLSLGGTNRLGEGYPPVVLPEGEPFEGGVHELAGGAKVFRNKFLTSNKAKSGAPELKADQCLRLMLQIAKGMQFLHDHDPPILHRDLKSHNVCLDGRMAAKICDFGVSRAWVDTTMTRVGTPQWMAPEVLRNESYCVKADVYSYAVLMWELVSFQSPFRLVNPLAVVSLVASSNVRMEIPPLTPARLIALIERCWHDVPTSRPSFSEIVEELDAAVPELIAEIAARSA